MAATNYTPIQLYHSTTASAVPVNTNLVNGELAINITDGKLYYKDNGGTVQVIATKATGTIGGSDTQVQYNSSGALAGSSNFTFNGTTATINTLNLTNALGATYGGTAQSSWTTGDLLYASGSNTLAKLGIGLNTYILTSNGTIPGWAAPSAISVNTATNLAGGAAGSVPYQSGAGATTFLSIGTANQVVTSTGSAPQWSSGLSITTLTASDAVTFSATTQNIALGTSQTSGTFTVGGTAQTGNIAIDRSTKTHTLNIGTGITESGQTKTINIGTAGDTGSTTAITIGSANGTTITVNGTVNASTLDLTNLEVTNIKAKDGTAAMSIADSTGVVSITANPVLSGGTANGVLYLNAGKVATSGSALTFDGTALTVGSNGLYLSGNTAGSAYMSTYGANTATELIFGTSGNIPIRFIQNNTEKIRLLGGAGTNLNIGGNFTSTNNTLQVTGNAAIGYTTAAPTTGLIVAGNVGIGTDAPSERLTIVGNIRATGNIVTGVLNANCFVRATSSVAAGGSGFSEFLFANATSNSQGYLSYNHATDTLLIGTNTVTRAEINSSGTLILRQSSNAANTSVSFNTTVQNALTLDSSGNLGVGVASPGAKLQVGWSSDQLKFTNPSAGFKQIGSSYTGYVSGNDYSAIILGTDGSAGGKIQFSTMPSGGALTTAATIDQYGNLGLGVTPTNNTLGTTFQNEFAALTADGTTPKFWLGSNWYYNGGDKYLANGQASLYSQQSGQHIWWYASNNTSGAGAVMSPVQAMTLDASGNLLVGITSASFASGGGINVKNSSTSNVRVISGSNTGFDLSQDTSGNTYVYNRDNGFTAFATNNTERARITSGGYFKASNDGTYLGSTGTYHEFRNSAAEFTQRNTNTNATTPYGYYIQYTAAAPNGTGSQFLYCEDNVALRAEIRSNGGIANYSANNVALSDQRTKKDIVAAPSYWDKIKGIEIVHFKYKDQTHDDNNVGVIAQQVEQVAPEFVDQDGWGETPEDGVPLKSIYTSDMYHAAIKALQEAMARIEKLEAEVAALKGA